MRSVLAVGLMTLLAFPEASGTPAESGIAGHAGQPNVLIVMTDDQRALTLGVMKRTRRWLRRGGTAFPRAFATTPLCCPSRSSVFTGRYTHNHGVADNSQEQIHELDQDQTVQAHLQAAGYQTGIVGKFLNKWLDDPPHFDRWSIYSHKYRPTRWNLQGRMKRVTRYAPDLVRRRALATLRWFDQRDRKPWLLYVTPFSPHPWGLKLPPRHRGVPVPRWNRSPAVGEADKSDKPPFIQQADWPVTEAAQLRRKQLRALLAIDDMMGSLRRELKALAEQRDTLVIFLSDHGMMWSEHGWSNKRVPYTEAVRIPLLARWPGHLPYGRDRRLATNVDVATTVLDAAGLDVETDGTSLLAPSHRQRILLEHLSAPATSARTHHAPVPWTWASTRTNEYQYVEYYDDTGIVFREYYDLVKDRWQMVNLLEDGDPGNDPPATDLAALSARLAQDRTCMGEECP